MPNPTASVLETQVDQFMVGIHLDLEEFTVTPVKGWIRAPRLSGFSPPIPLETPLAAESLPPEPSERLLPLPQWTRRGAGVPYRDT